MAAAADVARTEVQATVNREMIDGAKKAAKDAVAEIVPDVAKQAAQEAVRQMLEAQRAEKAAALKKHN
jgi:hypothetical protein